MNKYALKKALPTILIGVATVGVLGTGYLAAKGKEKQIERRLNNPDPANTKEKLKINVVPYLPAAAVGTVSIGCMWASHVMSAKQIAALTAACGYFATYRDKLEQKIRDRFGEEELKEIKQEIMLEMEHEPWGKISIPTAEETGNGELLVVEGYSGRTFRSSEKAVREGIKKFQNILKEGYGASLNDLYDCLDIQETHFGNQYGYPGGEDYKTFFNEEGGIRIDVELVEKPVDMDEPVLCIDIYDYPMECWMEY